MFIDLNGNLTNFCPRQHQGLMPGMPNGPNGSLAHNCFLIPAPLEGCLGSQREQRSSEDCLSFCQTSVSPPLAGCGGTAKDTCVMLEGQPVCSCIVQYRSEGGGNSCTDAGQI